MKWCWPFVPPCKWYLTLAIITACCWDRWAPRRMAEREQSGAAAAGPGQALRSLSGHTKLPFPPSGITSGFVSPSCPQESLRGWFCLPSLCPGTQSKDRAHGAVTASWIVSIYVSLPSGGKSCPTLTVWGVWGCSSAPCSPGVDGLTPLPISLWRTWFSFHLWKGAQGAAPGCTQTRF